MFTYIRLFLHIHLHSFVSNPLFISAPFLFSQQCEGVSAAMLHEAEKHREANLRRARKAHWKV